MVNAKHRFWVLIAALLALAACAQQATESAAEVDVEKARPIGAGELDPMTLLALGTLKLEDTENAVSTEQAAELLPLWKMLESGALQGEAESSAVLEQIEGKMAAEQLAAIDGMGLTFEDTQAWMASPFAEALGIEMAPPNDGDAQGAPGGQGAPAPGAMQNLSEEKRAQMRQEFSSMSAEERATRMAEMGVQRPEGQEPDGMGAPPGSAGRQANVLLGPLVELLTERSAG